MTRLVSEMLVLIVTPLIEQEMRYLMMIPLRCEKRGGDQKRVIFRELVKIFKF